MLRALALSLPLRTLAEIGVARADLELKLHPPDFIGRCENVLRAGTPPWGTACACAACLAACAALTSLSIIKCIFRHILSDLAHKAIKFAELFALLSQRLGEGRAALACFFACCRVWGCS